MSELREIMRRNFESGAVDKMLPQRWCSGDDARIVYERWQKLFDDFDEKKIEKFDPARVSLEHTGRSVYRDDSPLESSTDFRIVRLAQARRNSVSHNSATRA